MQSIEVSDAVRQLYWSLGVKRLIWVVVLHCKKKKLNTLIYHLQLTLANTWNNLWHHMLRMIEDRLQIEILSKYKTLDKKLNHLSQQQTRTPNYTTVSTLE